MRINFFMNVIIQICNRSYILIGWLCMTVLDVSGQSTINLYTTHQLNYMAPQTWSFMNYTKTDVNLYTGTANIEIPIYTYSDADFTIPLSLVYTSNGFMPQQQTGPVGLNWFLNVGGYITREIYDIDDFQKQSLDSFGDIQGFLFSTNNNYSDSSILLNPSLYFNNIYYANATGLNKQEVTSDIYHFNFMGHKGTFHYDNTTRMCQIYNTNGNSGAYTITYQNSNENICFTIITPDGYKYIFGPIDFDDESKYYEISGDATKVSWLLNKVIALNGREIKFYYQTKGHKILTVGESYEYNGENFKCVQQLQSPYLSQIKIDGGVEFLFNYSPKETKEIMTTTNKKFYVDFISKLQILDKLDSICIKHNNTLMNLCSLSYFNHSNRTFLQNVSLYMHNTGVYKMEYYLPSVGNLPDLLSNSVDFWHYANGKSATDNDVYAGTETVNASFDERSKSNGIKCSNATYGVYGNLKKVIYPTGGYTEFEYEGHTASYAVLKRATKGPIKLSESNDVSWNNYMASVFPIETLNINGNVGGIRIKKITKTANNGNVMTRLFEYEKDNKSSGNLLFFPRYLYKSANSNTTYDLLCRLLWNTRSTLDKTHIEYSRVTEILSNGSKIEYNFSNYLDIPDDYSDQKYIDIVGYPSLDINQEIYMNIRREPNSRHLQRGKLISQIYFNSQGDTIKSVTNKYDNYKYRFSDSDYSTSISVSGPRIWTKKIYTTDTRVAKTKILDYTFTGKLATTIDYKYDNWGRLTSTVQSNGFDSVLYWNRYVHNLETDNVLKALYNQHRYNTVLCEFIGNYKERSHISGIIYKYGLFDDRLYLKRIGKITLQDVSGTDYATLTPLSPITFDKYGRYGRVLQETNENGLIISYIWGYGGLYLVAVVENADLNMIKRIDGLDNIESDPLQTGLNNEQEQQLRNISDAHVTTYTYKPMLGNTSVSDTSGRRKTYDYDTSGRLITVKDESGNIIERYDYRYKDQN